MYKIFWILTSFGFRYVLSFIFLFSLAVEPLYPQVCHKVAVFKETLPGEGPSPVDLSRSLNSIACSISFRREDPISIFHLIMEVSYLCFTQHDFLFIGSFVSTFKFVKLLGMSLAIESKVFIMKHYTVVAVNEAIQQVSTQTMQAVI